MGRWQQKAPARICKQGRVEGEGLIPPTPSSPDMAGFWHQSTEKAPLWFTL